MELSCHSQVFLSAQTRFRFRLREGGSWIKAKSPPKTEEVLRISPDVTDIFLSRLGIPPGGTEANSGERLLGTGTVVGAPKRLLPRAPRGERNRKAGKS
jgi:hypothetical protein